MNDLWSRHGGQAGKALGRWFSVAALVGFTACRGHASTSPAVKEFCDLGVQASRGWVAMDGPVEENPLVKASGLSSREREVVRKAVTQARRQVVAGNGLNTTSLVNVVNGICGLNLAPINMFP